MADEAGTVEAPEPETPSAEGAPEGEGTPETPSEEPEGEETPPDEQPDEDAAEAEEPDAWKNFQKKFDHLKDDHDKKAAMGKAYWDKTNYASRVSKERDELRAALAATKARLEGPPAEEAPPPGPHPDIQKLDQRIQGLVQKDNALIQGQGTLLTALRSADEEIIRWKTKAEDATDEYQKALFEQKGETASVKKATLLQRWSDVNDRREQLSYDVERLMSDRNWVEQFVSQEESRRVSQQQSEQEFNQEFPRFVNSQIEEIAAELGVPASADLRADLRSTVRDKMTVALWKLSKADADEVDVPTMIRGYVQGYMKRNDLVSRSKFATTSKAKLAVSSGKAPVKPTPTTTAKARTPGTPVRIAQLAQGELTQGMARARSYLASRGL